MLSNVIWLCHNCKHYLVLLATPCPENPYLRQRVLCLPCHSSMPWIPINQWQSSRRERLTGKVQCKAHWSHILKLKRMVLAGKYTTVQFWISPDLRSSQTPMFSIGGSYHLKELYGRAGVLQGVGRFITLISQSCTGRIFYSLYKNIF